MTNGWRVRVVQDDSSFAQDNVKIYMGYRNDNGLCLVRPIELIVDAPIAENTDYSEGNIIASVIPRELAEALFNALCPVLTDVNDVVVENRRLRRELGDTKTMLHDLIRGVGRMAPKTGD